MAKTDKQQNKEKVPQEEAATTDTITTNERVEENPGEGKRDKYADAVPPGWWRKKEAVDFLGVTERSLQRFAKQGLIESKMIPVIGGTITVYLESDVRRYKHDQENRAVGARSPNVMPSKQSPTAASEQTALTRQTAPEQLALNERFIDALENLGRPTPSSSVPIENKLVLTLEEASALTSLSTSFLRKGIKEGTLKARIMGRGYRVKRTDLDAYVKKL
jgi:excisionase family DNA binding protein